MIFIIKAYFFVSDLLGFAHTFLSLIHFWIKKTDPDFAPAIINTE